MRLDKLLANMGFGSRKDVKQLAKRGAVTVDGCPVRDVASHVDPKLQAVAVDGVAVEYRASVYLMLHKPPGVVSATEDARDQTVIDLVSAEYGHFDLFPVGRLDKDTEGLLLLTNDGALAHKLLSPKHDVPKRYFAEVEGVVTEEDAARFRRGVLLDDGYVTRPGDLRILEAGSISRVEVTIAEGKFHQVKRMFQAVGKRVLYLKRLSMGALILDPALALGDYRELTEKELAALRA